MVWAGCDWASKTWHSPRLAYWPTKSTPDTPCTLAVNDELTSN
jgi:hypothetical protein